MIDDVVLGDPASCSRLGGAMRREAAKLGERLATLSGAGHELRHWQGRAGVSAREQLDAQLAALAATARDLDEAGAALQRYATDLAEARELGRRAADRARQDGLRIVDGRVLEAWGPATAEEAERRRALIPANQARVDRVASMVGRSRAHLQRACEQLTLAMRSRSRALRDAPPQSV